MNTESDVRDELAKEVFHGIPEKGKLESMSFSDLAVELAGCEKGSAKFLVVKREIFHRNNEIALSLAREANSIAAKARSDACIANIIAITAIVLSTATAITVAFIQS